jgi:hypothetical protein
MEKEEFDLLDLPPRNHKKDHLINLKIYVPSYLFHRCHGDNLRPFHVLPLHVQTCRHPSPRSFLRFREICGRLLRIHERAANLLQHSGPKRLLCDSRAPPVGQHPFNPQQAAVHSTGRPPAQKEAQLMAPSRSAHVTHHRHLCHGGAGAFRVFLARQACRSSFGSWPLPLALGILVMDETRKLVVRTRAFSQVKENTAVIDTPQILRSQDAVFWPQQDVCERPLTVMLSSEASLVSNIWPLTFGQSRGLPEKSKVKACRRKAHHISQAVSPPFPSLSNLRRNPQTVGAGNDPRGRL